MVNAKQTCKRKQDMNGSILKIALVTNTLAPYRNPVFAEIGKTEGIQLRVFCCTKLEPNRHWDLPPIDFECHFLHEHIITFHDRYIHNNLDVLPALQKFAPDVVVTDGLNPTHLYAFFFAKYRKIPHICMTDGTLTSERILTAMHRLVRRYVYARSQAYIAASEGGFDLFDSYLLPHERYYKSCLCIDNQAYAIASSNEEKKFDFMMCGRYELVKNPFFVIDVAIGAAKRLQRQIHVLFVGSGSLESRLKAVAELFPGLIKITFFGQARQNQLPQLYRSARLFLFPSLWEPWGVVVNEACAAGLPVIASPFAGTSHELVREEYNGFICKLEVELWVDKAVYLLTQPAAYQRFSDNSKRNIQAYSFANASDGVVAACRFVTSENNMKLKNTPQKKPRVLIVERQLLQYRSAFYNQLKSMLDKEGVELQLLTGNGTPAEVKKKNQVVLDWSIRIPTHYLFGTSLCWQPFGQYAKAADLVIVMHENKILYNLWLMSFGRPKRLAFWGHGRNMQSDNPNGLKERFKRWTVNKVDWWFAYTNSSAAFVADAGFPSQCTTVVDNAVDTEALAKLCAEISPEAYQQKREELKLGNGPVGLYLGSLYKEKRLNFLLEAAIKIHDRIPTFHLLIAGAGPEQEQIEAAALTYPWIHYLGPILDKEKALALTISDVILNPGLVGLGILDSFASGTPMFTTDCGLHSPEISYLHSGKNGVMTEDNIDIYTDTVSKFLLNHEQLLALKVGALSSAPHYTIDNMVNRIQDGILACLAS